MPEVPSGATQEVRMRMCCDYARDLVALNPHAFLPPEVKRRWWHLFKCEYPQILVTATVNAVVTDAPLYWPLNQGERKS
jgi:hypothetical protein